MTFDLPWSDKQLRSLLCVVTSHLEQEAEDDQQLLIEAGRIDSKH